MYPGTHAKRTPNKTAVVLASSGDVLTYGELNDRSTRLAHVLRAGGLRVGDRLAIVMGNDLDYVVACWAAKRIGLYYVPINWHLTLPEIAFIVNNCGAKALVLGADFSESGPPLLQQLNSVRLALSADVEAVPGFESLEAAISAAADEDLKDETSGADMVYTSGTTGLPKGGWKTLSGLHPAEDNRHVGMAKLFDMNSKSRYLTPGAPLYHAAPLRFVMTATQVGATNVLMDRFDAEASLATIERYGITHSQWVPTMFVRLLRLPADTRSKHSLGSHKVAIHAAAPCPIGVKKQMINWWGPILREYYGASEGGGSTLISSEEWLEHCGSVGRAMEGLFHILDENGLELPPGQVGVIYAEGVTPIHYFDDPAKTELAHNPAGWATVGDMGYVDGEGYLYLTDRKDHMIISGGVNIYPQESENVLAEHPKVADVAVIGVPNDDLGEEVKAVVQLVDPDDAGQATVDELLASCRRRLAHYKCPRSIDFVTELPRSSAGKLYKRQLRDKYWAAQKP